MATTTATATLTPLRACAHCGGSMGDDDVIRGLGLCGRCRAADPALAARAARLYRLRTQGYGRYSDLAEAYRREVRAEAARQGVTAATVDRLVITARMERLYRAERRALRRWHRRSAIPVQ